jgi:hypothetical protein
MASDADLRWPALSGVGFAGVGLFLSVISLEHFAALQPLEGFWFGLGIALFILGIGALAYAIYVWQGHEDDWGYPVTFGALAALIVIAAWASQYGSVVLFAVSAGAIGGLAHEVAQSNGKIAVPGKKKSTTPGAAPGAQGAAPGAQGAAPGAQGAAPGAQGAAPGAQGAAPGVQGAADNEIYLGSLTGMFLGGVAGALILSATQQVGLSLGLAAFMAGLALKGVSEAASTAATR